MRLFSKLVCGALGALILQTQQAYGWGKDGHCLVGSAAAQVLASEGKALFKNHRFDFCYYNNVPDLIWKAPATYESERHEHYFNLEPVLRVLKKEGKTLQDLPRKRSELEGSNIEKNWGQAPWRIQELYDQITSLAKRLQKKPENHRELQAQWLVVAGVLGHYIADLAQPLHCTENYDGQLTGQKGLHSHFESSALGELLPELEAKVVARARQGWAEFSKKARKKNVFQLSVELCQSSLALVPEVLKLDKKAGRKNLKGFAREAEELLLERLTAGALHLAEIWRRQSNWPYDAKKFYDFSGSPEHIPPGAPKN